MGCVESRRVSDKVLTFNHINTDGIYGGVIENQQIYLSIDSKLRLYVCAKCEWALSLVILEIREIQLNEHGEGNGIIKITDTPHKTHIKLDQHEHSLKITMTKMNYYIELY